MKYHQNLDTQAHNVRVHKHTQAYTHTLEKELEMASYK